jgi:glycosyltransferase involved in cell wall biosynthesis
MRQQDRSLIFWLHTDRQVTEAWSIPQLATDLGLNDGDMIVTLPGLSDYELAGLYSQCLATIAPGLGEGFGYPIVESLACGTPVIHGQYGGGTELIPENWRVRVDALRLEGAYALRRPVYDPAIFADVALDVVGRMREFGAVMQGACRGMVAHLDWNYLWPRWMSWFKGRG